MVRIARKPLPAIFKVVSRECSLGEKTTFSETKYNLRPRREKCATTWKEGGAANDRQFMFFFTWTYLLISDIKNLSLYTISKMNISCPYLALFSCVLFSVFSSYILYLKLNKALEIMIRTNAIMIQLYHRNIEANMLIIIRKKKQEFHPL